jgi:hypothetical protein
MTGSRLWPPTLAAAGLAIALVGGAVAQPRIFELNIEKVRLPENQRLVRVRQGEEVILKWRADQAVVLHLHGYDIEARVSPAAWTEMRFTAAATGRFPIELHAQTHATIAHLEVHPR